MEIQKNKVSNEFQLKKQKKTPKKVKKIFFWIKFLLVLITFSIIIISLALSPVCNINKIDVQDIQYYSKDDIISATDITLGDNAFRTLFRNVNAVNNVFMFRLGVSEQNILKSHPYIKDIEVKYIIPNRININITQRDAICSIPYLGTNLLMDNEGYIVDAKENLDKIELPQIKGIGFEGYELGKALKVKEQQGINDSSKIIMTVSDSDKKDSLKLLGFIKTIDVSDSNKIYLFIDNRLVVNIGNLTDLDYKIGFLKQIYFKKLKKEDKGMLDFSTGNNPNFIPER